MIRRPQLGFTLVEMIMVIVITGIIGGIVAVFLRAPIDQYIDVSRRANMTDIADTAIRRVTRDLRLALPNSVRVGNAAGTPCNGAEACYLEFIPTIGGGRYRDSEDNLAVPPGAGCGSLAGDVLNFTSETGCFEVLGNLPPMAVGDQIVVYNLGITGADAYVGNNRRAVSGVGAMTISFTPASVFPFDSCIYDAGGIVVGGCRFQVVQTPVTYVCDPTAVVGGNSLTRWQGYAIQAIQPKALPGGGTATLLATNVTACSFAYDANMVAQRSGLVTMLLAITEDAETATLYNAAHVSNLP